MKPNPHFPVKSFLFTCLFIGMTIGGIIAQWAVVACGSWVAAVVSGVVMFHGFCRKPEGRRLRGIFLPVVLMLGLMAFLTVREAQAVPQSSGDKQELIAMLCVGLVVLIVGAVVIVSLKKMCDRINPPPKKENPPQPPPGTNCPPYYEGPITLSAGSTKLHRFEFDDEAAEVWDISDYSATNAALHDPVGQPYIFEFNFKFRTATNFTTWTTNSIHGYVSQAFTHVTTGTNSMLVPRQYRPMISVPSGGAAGFFQPVR